MNTTGASRVDTSYTLPRRGCVQRRRCDNCHRQHKRCEKIVGFDKCQECCRTSRECKGGSFYTSSSRPAISAIATLTPDESSNVYNPSTAFRASARKSDTTDPEWPQLPSVREHELCWEFACLALQVLLARCTIDCELQLARLSQDSPSSRGVVGNAIPRGYSHSLNEDLKAHKMKTKQMIQALRDADRHLLVLHHRFLIRRGWRASGDPRAGVERQSSPPYQAHAARVQNVVLACTANILTAPETGTDFDHHLHAASFTSSRPCWQDYLVTESVVNEFLRKELGSFLSRLPSGAGFTAEHIAYSNHDFRSLKELWLRRPGCRHSIDPVGRRLALVLIEHSNCALLAELVATDKSKPGMRQMVPGAGVDFRGMSLLSMAASLGHADNFGFLRGEGATYNGERALLDFALIGGNEKTIDQIVMLPGMVEQPYTRELKKAIELRCPILARSFFNAADRWSNYGYDEIQGLSDLAKSMSIGTDDMEQLSRDLLRMSLYDNNHQSTIDDLDRAHAFMQQWQGDPITAKDNQAGTAETQRTWAQVAEQPPHFPQFHYQNQAYGTHAAFGMAGGMSLRDSEQLRRTMH